MDECAESLFRGLLQRVIEALPTGESLDGERVSFLNSEIGDIAREKFLRMLMDDRNEYVEGLDIFEARFGVGIRTLRIDAERNVLRKEKLSKRVDIEDRETGEMSLEGEKASAFAPFDRNKLDDLDYVARLNKAFDELEPLQKAIIEMDRNGFATESTDPEKGTISKLLGYAPKTIRAHRDLAHSALRTALTKGEPL